MHRHNCMVSATKYTAASLAAFLPSRKLANACWRCLTCQQGHVSIGQRQSDTKPQIVCIVTEYIEILLLPVEGCMLERLQQSRQDRPYSACFPVSESQLAQPMYHHGTSVARAPTCVTVTPVY